MKAMDTRLNSTNKGQILQRLPENDFIIEFGNIAWRLSFLQFQLLKKFIERIDGAYYEDLNKSSFYRRKIRIPIKTTNISILLNLEELEDLKNLLSGIPENYVEENEMLSSLFNLSEDLYDRFEIISQASIIHPSIYFNLN
jgi:hypothetical protein